MQFSAHFACVAGCPGQWPLDEVIYRCPSCNGLLEVEHDKAAWKQRSPVAWARTFDERWGDLVERLGYPAD